MPFPEVGTQAMDFVTQTDSGDTVKLSDFRGKQVILYFYPKADTPGCTKQACNFRDNYHAFAERGVVVLGVSPDTVEAQAAFKTKYSLPFTLLADPDHAIADLYGVWGEHTVNVAGEAVTYTGVRRSTLIIDENGIVIDARWGVDPANDTQTVLQILDASRA